MLSAASKRETTRADRLRRGLADGQRQGGVGERATPGDVGIRAVVA